MNEPSLLRILILGAHPDDAEYHAGGLAARHAKLGNVVKLVSVTNGGAGHHRLPSDELVAVRRKEAAAAGAIIGAEYETWDFPDGSLQADLPLRLRIIEEIRRFRPDLVLTHRPWDYHPDHRAVGQAVQDASYMVTVPLMAPHVPFLKRDPVVACMSDEFTRPAPLQADVLINVSDELETVIDMLACHESQVYDFLPFNEGIAESVPTEPSERRDWLRTWYTERVGWRNDRFSIPDDSPPQSSTSSHQLLEAYEISEYASDLSEEDRNRFFPPGA
ncbi:MAG: PIG-L family deacetylase [bacterium]|nr:PIG-L family deacetylase [bacterium]